MGKKRLFTATSRRRGTEIDFSTTLTDAQAVKLLGGIVGEEFNNKCAFEINQLRVSGANPKEGLIAWGFFNANKIANGEGPKPLCVLSAQLMRRVVCGRPYRREIEGCTVLVKQGGARAKVPGRYVVDDGGEYRNNQFYGFGDEESGEWQPTDSTPQNIIDLLTSENAVL